MKWEHTVCSSSFNCDWGTYSTWCPCIFAYHSVETWVDVCRPHCHWYSTQMPCTQMECLLNIQYELLSVQWVPVSLLVINCTWSVGPLCRQLWSLHFCSTVLSLKVMLLFWLNIWPMPFPATTCRGLGLLVEPVCQSEYECLSQVESKGGLSAMHCHYLDCYKKTVVCWRGSLLVRLCVCAQLRRAEGTLFALR